MSGFLARAKDAAEKATDAAADHTDKIDTGIDKVADLADKATGGKQADKIDAVQVKAHGARSDREAIRGRPHRSDRSRQLTPDC